MPSIEKSTARRTIATVALTLGVLLQSASGSTTPPYHLVAPTLTDKGLTGPVPGSGKWANVTLPPVGTAKGKLFVFLSGTGGAPAGYSKVEIAAAELGFHVIGLVYPNDKSVQDICSGKSTDCPEGVRKEIITGQDLSPYVQVNYTNSIDNRLVKLLQYLNATYPKEGWASYLSGNNPAWQKIVVGGHSQGGGHAAMIGQLYIVNRVLMFSATENANWTTKANKTPATAYYAFADTRENNYNVFVHSWDNLKVPGGSVTSVDGTPSAYTSSHRLVTGDPPAAMPNDTDPFHSVVVTDAYTPMAGNGTPLFVPVWQYMLGK